MVSYVLAFHCTLRRKLLLQNFADADVISPELAQQGMVARKHSQTIIERIGKFIEARALRARQSGDSADGHKHVVYAMLKFVQQNFLFFDAVG